MMRPTNLLFASFVAAFSLPAWAQAPVKLGLLLDMAGPYADVGGQGTVTAVRMAVDDFGGNVLGRPIEVVFADHQNKVDLAGSLARQWFDEQGVETILDVAGSSAALAVNEVAKARNKILVVNASAVMRLTNEDCGPYTVHYAFDTYALAKGTGEATVKAGYDSWFFITADYVFGKELEKNTSAFVNENGGKVLGSVRVPLSTADFSSYLLQAQASRAKVVGLANAGADTINAIKQAGEFGLGKSGQRLAALLLYITDVNSLGLETAQGPAADRRILLGYERRDARLVTPLLRQNEENAEHDSSRRLFLHAPLSPGGQGRRNSRCERRDEHDESNADQRFLCT
jgi:branched-chain amino acid transport system substrate-binding protein